MIRRSRPLVVAVAAIAPLAICGAGVFASSAPAASPTIASTVPPIDDQATPDALDEAGEQSSESSFRLEMFMGMSGLGLSIDPETPLMTGEYTSEGGHIVMDLAGIFGELGDELPIDLRDLDMTMEVTTLGTDMFIRAPFLAAMANQAGGAEAPLDVFAALGDGWGYVDGSAIPGFDASQLTGTFGIGGADPGAFFDVLSDVDGAEAIGTEDIRGVGSVGVSAEVSLADLMAAQGAALPIPASGVDFASLTMPVEVWIGKDGFVRRIVLEFTPDALADAAESSGQEIDPSMLAGFEMSMTLEMYDYEATDIVIEAPTGFTDVTDEFIELFELFELFEQS